MAQAKEEAKHKFPLKRKVSLSSIQKDIIACIVLGHANQTLFLVDVLIFTFLTATIQKFSCVSEYIFDTCLVISVFQNQKSKRLG